AHIIDRPDEERLEDFNLYGQHCAVEFVARIRGMQAFTGIEDLIDQMDSDVHRASAILAGAAPEIDAPEPRSKTDVSSQPTAAPVLSKAARDRYTLALDTDHAELYHGVRPGYQADILDFLTTTTPGLAVDMGAGTGLFTERMLAAG